MTVTKDQASGITPLSAGPQLNTTESGVTDRPVHIIAVPSGVAVGQLQGDHITEAGQLALQPHIAGAHPTDIVVFENRAWHLANDALQPHPQVHIDFPATILKLHRERPDGPGRAVWWSEQQFDITTIEDEAAHDAREASGATTPPVDADPYPFTERPATEVERSIDPVPRDIFVARSTVPLVAGRYKISFTLNGQLIDPNMHCF